MDSIYASSTCTVPHLLRRETLFLPRTSIPSSSLRRAKKARRARVSSSASTTTTASSIASNGAVSRALQGVSNKSNTALEQLDIERGVCIPFRKYSPEIVRNKVLKSRGSILSLMLRGVEIVWNLGLYWSNLVYDFLVGRDEEVVPYRARQLRNLLCDLGPSFIKAGQVLANRPDIIREDYMNELCILQDDVPSFPNEIAFRIIEEDLGQPLEAVFSKISSETIAAASLGQVYRATLRATGEDVAIKVQRPGIEPIIYRDLFLFRTLASFLNGISIQKLGCNAELIVDEFGEKLLEELDYTLEARNLEDFLENFKNDPTVKIPQVYKQFSGQRVLVMEWIDGIRCTNPQAIKEAGIDVDGFLTIGVSAALRQLLEFGLFHGDPHPGNIFAMRDGRIAYVDFGNVAVLSQVLHRDFSDHCPVILKTKMVDWGPKPFRVMDCWLKHKGYISMVKEAWSADQQIGWGAVALKNKLRNLRFSIKQWCKDKGDIKAIRIQNLKQKLCDLETIASNRTLSDLEVKAKRALQQELWDISTAYESLLRQKSRAKWIKEGDSNSAYFHKIINFRRSSNAVHGFLIDGAWVQQPDLVKNEAANFFLQRFTEQNPSRPTLDGVCFPTIDQNQSQGLTGPFTDLEIKEAVWGCDGDKCPGPDGFNFNFIKEFWGLLKPDFRRFVDEFHAHGSFPRGSNASFVALIPKISQPQSLNDYRPISLIGCMYKIVAKLLANRLKLVLPSLIDERQSAFIKNRHILHGIVILNEVIDEAIKRNKPAMIFKVDFEKAYDSVSWAFLDYMLQRLGFCMQWRKWISACLQSATIFVLINGSPSKEFVPSRGLRQGDPLAPLLFNIVAEGLTGMMREALNKNLYRSFLVGKQNVPINILQYADDTVFLGEASWDNVLALKSMLRGFEMASGLKINYAKSHFGAVGMQVNWVQAAAAFLNCRHMDTPFKYLGMPIGVKPSSRMVWEPLINKFEAKLSKWNQKNLSMGGRITLIKSVLNALPIYLLSFFKIPQSIVDKLVSLQRNFLWGGNHHHKKISWVKWEVVCLPKSEGGLGIKNLSSFNAALRGKWIWDLVSNHNQLWGRVLISKYGGWSDLKWGRDKGWQSQWWKDLRKLYHQPDSNIIQQYMVWKVGCGDQINFWQDTWLGEGCNLQQKYNPLFLISRQQHLSISKMGKFSQNTWFWDLKWRRNLFDHENDLAIAFMDDISAIPIQQHVQDTMVWKAEPNGLYSTKSAYRLLMSPSSPVPHRDILQNLWKLKIPPRAAVFSWRLCLDRLPTRANLLRRNIHIQDTLCPLCESHQEEAGHLFFHCKMTRGMWGESMKWIRAIGALSADPASHFIQFCNGFGAGSRYSRVCGWWIALTLTIWQHRNSLLFKGTPFDPHRVMDEALFLAWSWLKARVKGFNTHFNHWSTNLQEAFG